MKFEKVSRKQKTAIVVVLLLGIILGVLILRTDKPLLIDGEHGASEAPAESSEVSKVQTSDHQHQMQPDEVAKGPHGGRLFIKDGYSLELTIFEQNTEPEFRVYSYWNNEPIEPSASTVTITLERLGRAAELFTFSQEKDYLKGNAVVEEPHSFDVKINARYQGKVYQFNYEQVETRVKISKEQILHNNIEILTAGPAKIKATLQLQGEIKLNADKSVHVVPRVEGIVESVTANAGDKVRKGQVLATVSSQAVAELRSDLQAAQKRTNLARTTYEREKQLWEDKISAQQDYLQAQHDLQEAEINTSRIQQKLSAMGAGATGQTRYEIRSPIDGVITNKQISQGQVVATTDNVFEVADLATVWAEMTIYAKDLNTVKVGQQVTVKATAFEAQTTGTIAYVGALVGEQTRTAIARVVLNNSSRVWLPGLPVNVDLISDEVDVPLAVSVEGIQTLRDWSVVFGRYGDFFEARPLTLGRRDDKYVEVLKGIKAGEQYAAGNSFLIKADIGKAGASHDH